MKKKEILKCLLLLQSQAAWFPAVQRLRDSEERAMYNMDVGLELERHFLLDNHSYSSASSSELFLCDDDSNLSDCSSYSYSSDQEGGSGQYPFVFKRYFGYPFRKPSSNGCTLRNRRVMYAFTTPRWELVGYESLCIRIRRPFLTLFFSSGCRTDLKGG